ncbi:hypothetical protein IT399_02350 [Candidatus Nomurabacteria bacterium]|nr:hypothetical protein [Candidatus Nomurabacteria bacterium]
MMRFIMPIILIGISVTMFFMFTNPLYGDISKLRAEVSSYNEALANSKALENERDKLTAKYNTINVDDLMKIEKLMPENVDNIRLILEIEKIATPYGMVLKNVKYNTTDTSTTPTSAIQSSQAKGTPKDYGVFDLEFSISSTYNNFINFTKDLESNLRIVDISSVSFTSNVQSTGPLTKVNQSDNYTFNFKIKTYWLKN